MKIIFPIAFGSPPPRPEDELIRLIIEDDRQGGRTLIAHSGLMAAAKERSLRLAAGSPFAHTDERGITPNEYVRASGCALPRDYGPKGNQVESLAGGTASARIIRDALANSPSHSDHLFGRGWFSHQRHIGIGLAEGGQFGWYWTILIALCVEESGE